MAESARSIAQPVTRLYWPGNSAKSRILNEVLARATSASFTVFDYGTGQGGDWPQVLADHPHIHLVAYEPHASSREELVWRMAGQPHFRLLDEVALAQGQARADAIVSFSVFEHVLDRAAYLGNAKRNLKPGGVIFLNYDDGHFRQRLELDLPRTWMAPLVEHARNLLAPLWPKLKREYLYQKRVGADLVAVDVRAAGLKIVADTYENLADFKNLAKTIAPAQQEAFLRFWLETEARLNREFRAASSLQRGDTVNLWQACLSRTLELTHL